MNNTATTNNQQATFEAIVRVRFTEDGENWKRPFKRIRVLADDMDSACGAVVSTIHLQFATTCQRYEATFYVADQTGEFRDMQFDATWNFGQDEPEIGY